ncbi:MAG: hypothetical protein LWW95_10100 [Candidatus Desulfofervidus auxilii]|nr:hypothetical protein [Candidatus Desulfofervidus auxilii]
MSEVNKRKKSFADKVNAVKESAPLTEKKKSTPRQKKSIGQPKKEARLKQDKTIVIYVNEEQLKKIEERSVEAGYKAKDRAKWLKSIAIGDSVSKEELDRLKLQLEEKENQIKMLKDILTSQK